MNTPKLEAEKQNFSSKTNSDQWNQKLLLWKDQQNLHIPLARLTKKERSLKLLKIRNKSTTNFTEIKGLVREHSEQSYANKLDNLDEMSKFLETHKLPRPKQKKKDTDSVIKQNKLPTKKTQDHMALSVNSSKYLKKN